MTMFEKQSKDSYLALSLGSIRFLFCKLLKRSFNTLPSGCRTKNHRIISGTVTGARCKAYTSFINYWPLVCGENRRVRRLTALPDQDPGTCSKHETHKHTSNLDQTFRLNCLCESLLTWPWSCPFHTNLLIWLKKKKKLRNYYLVKYTFFYRQLFFSFVKNKCKQSVARGILMLQIILTSNKNYEENFILCWSLFLVCSVLLIE